MEDRKLRLLTNRLPVMVDDIPVYSPLLLDIADVGMKKYHEYIGLCTVGVGLLDGEPDEDVDDFTVLTLFVIQQEGFYSKFIESLKFFTRLEFDIHQNEDGTLFFFCGDIRLDMSNYNEFMRVIKLVTCIKDDIPEEELDEFDKAILEAEKAIADVQGDDNEQPTLRDLISSVCNMDENGLSILNIWDINIYSFYDQMSRAQMKEEYLLGIKQVLAGADSKDIKTEYYIKKTD